MSEEPDFANFSHKMTLIVDMKMYTFDQTKIPLTPYSWYRACMAVDTIGGAITVVVNGNKEVDQVVTEFENSFQKRPKSMKFLTGKKT